MLVFILGIHLLSCASLDAITFDLSKVHYAANDQVEQIPPTFFLAKLEIIPDIVIEEDELRTLIDLPEKMLTTREAVAHAISQLAKKQKFKTVTCDLIPDQDGFLLRIGLDSNWTLARVRMKGSLIGKDKYRHAYFLQPGSIFDSVQHVAGKEAVLQALAAEGYCNALVTDTIVRDEARKSVVVTLAIDQKKQFVIRDITVHLHCAEGVHLKDHAALEKKITKLVHNLLKSGAYSKDLLDRSAKKINEYLISLGFFTSTISLEEALDHDRASVQLVFDITLRQKNLFEFRGNSFFSTQKLLEQIQLFGKSATLLPPSLIAEEFTALYKKEGFWDANISWEDDGERIFFFIHEGKRVGISEINIQGACEIPECELIKKYGKILLSARYFHEDLLKQMLDEIGQRYVSEGFWDFSIIGYDYTPLAESSYRLLIRINEGKRRFLTGVTLEDDFGCTIASIARFQSLAAPLPFDVRIIQEHKHALTKTLQAQGRLYARPYPELVEEKDGTRLVWKYAGSTEVVTFGDTIIAGNSSLPAHIMSRELLYKKEEVWNQQKIEKSVARLKQLGIFDSVTIAPENIATPELSKNLVLTYVEDAPYEFRVRGGIQGVNKNIVQFNAKGLSYKAGGSFLAKNPLNSGDCLRCDLDFSRYMYNVVASYKFPWLFGQPIRTELKAYTSHYDQPFVIGSPLVLYTAVQDGFLAAFSKNYSRCDIDMNIGCEWMEINPGDGCGGPHRLAQAIFLNPRLICKKYPYIFLQPSFFYSSLDNKIQPTKGALSLITCKGMITPTFSRAAFFKIIVEQSFFAPLGPFVLAWRGRCGTIVNAHFQDINPIERFYLGGAYSLRSYEPDLAPPLNPFRDCNGCLHLVATGGRTMANMNTELRFPLYKSLSGVVFNDIGALSDKSIQAAVKEHTLLGALGFGLRINTVVGPIRFDIGWKLKRNPVPHGLPQEKSYAWFLALGNAF